MTASHGGLHIESDWADALRQAGLDRFEALYNAPLTGPQSVRDHSRTGRLVLEDGRALYVKCAARTSVKRIATDMLCLRRPEPISERERRGLLQAAEAGITVPRPVAWGQRRRAGLPWRGVLAMTLLPGAALDQYLASAANADRASALAATGKALRKLHEAGLNWPDLRVKHVYVDAGASVGLLDLERLKVCRGRAGRRMRRHVSRFCAELRDAGARQDELDVMLAAMGRPDALRGGAAGE